jgi:nitrogen fixation protein FixH
MRISQENPQALRNPWVLGLLAFLFVFLTANAIFIYLAFETPPNLVVKDYYEKGEAHAKTQERINRQQELGWSGVLMLPPSARVNQTQTYEALITGKNSAGLMLDSVKLFAFRPSDAEEDFEVDMQPSGTGSYVADVSFNLPGTWDVLIEAHRGEDEFIITRRIRIEP